MGKAFALVVAAAGAGALYWQAGGGLSEQVAADRLANVVRIALEGSATADGVTGGRIPVPKVEVAGSPPSAGGGFVRSDRVRVAEAGERPRSPSEVKPTDLESRRALTRSIQGELRRVGCYGGDVDGSWSAATQRAMIAFNERVNASLPTHEPDFILLTLLQGQPAAICSKGCPTGQLAAADGRCVPRSVAEAERRSGASVGSDPARTGPAGGQGQAFGYAAAPETRAKSEPTPPNSRAEAEEARRAQAAEQARTARERAEAQAAEARRRQQAQADERRARLEAERERIEAQRAARAQAREERRQAAEKAAAEAADARRRQLAAAEEARARLAGSQQAGTPPSAASRTDTGSMPSRQVAAAAIPAPTTQPRQVTAAASTTPPALPAPGNAAIPPGSTQGAAPPLVGPSATGAGTSETTPGVGSPGAHAAAPAPATQPDRGEARLAIAGSPRPTATAPAVRRAPASDRRRSDARLAQRYGAGGGRAAASGPRLNAVFLRISRSAP